MQPSDEGQFAAAPDGTSRIVVRFIPQVASQFAEFGLACRPGLRADVPAVALLVQPGKGMGRSRVWNIRLMVRDQSGAVTTNSDEPLTFPMVTYGRLVSPVWLQMEFANSLIEAAFSCDGERWSSAGKSTCPAGGRLGLIASSGISEVSTAVRFEIVSL